MTKKLLVIAVLVLTVVIGYIIFSPDKADKQEQTAPTQPTLSYAAESQGCSNFLVYKLNGQKSEGIVVKVDKDKLKLSYQSQTFDVAKTEGLEVYILLGKEVTSSAPISFCGDAADPEAIEPARWDAKTGQATITISNAKVQFNEKYTATVILKNVSFVDEAGQNPVELKELIFKNVEVGWLPG